MSLLPVAERELRLLARRPRTYRSRGLTASVVILISLGMLYAGFGGLLSAASAGRNLFLILSCVAGVYVVLDGAILTADCLSQEKREGTLGLLFLTNLRGYDVVAGKLIAHSANSIYSLLAALPALGIAFFLGGVTGRDVVCMTQALLNGLFFSASFGMLVSACCRQERRALSLAVLGVLALTGLLPLLGWGLSLWLKTPAIHPFFLVGSPAGAFLHALDAGGLGQSLSVSFGGAMASSHLMAWCFLAAASLILPHDRGERSVRDTLRVSRPKGCRSTAAESDRRRRWLEENPLIWVGERRGQSGLGIGPVFVVFALAWAVGWALVRGHWLTLPVYALTAVLLHFSLIYFVLLQACRGPAEDQRSGVLEILLTTPLGDDAYLRGRMLSLKRQCFWPVLVVLAADLGLMMAGCWETGVWNWEWLGWIAAFIVLAPKLLVDLYTVSWVGVWQGLKVGHTGRAIRRTVFYVTGTGSGMNKCIS